MTHPTPPGLPDDDRRCTAKSKRSGERCQQWAVKGTTVCSMHGVGRKKKGKPIPQQRQVADQRAKTEAVRLEAHQRAERMASRAGVNVHPIDHLLDSLRRAAAMVAVYGEMVSDLDHAGEVEAGNTPGRQRGWVERTLFETEGGKSRTQLNTDPMIVETSDKTAQLHPFVAEYRYWISERAKIAKLALDAGVDERRIKMDEARATQVVGAVHLALENNTAKLTVDQRQAIRQAIAREFRELAEGA